MGTRAEDEQALRDALRFWVERADRFEKALPPENQYMKARGICSESYARGRAALAAAAPGETGQTP